MIKYKATYSGSTSLKTVTSTPSMSTTSFCVLDTIAPTIGPTPPPTYLPTSSPTYVFYKPTPSPVDHSDNIKQVMGLGLGATYDLAVADEKVTVAKVRIWWRATGRLWRWRVNP
jgi:hypothetical protein